MSAATGWTTRRGDEWWYTTLSLEASASFNEVPAALVIGELNTRGATLSIERLHLFLWQSHQQFPDEQIWLLLTPSTKPLVDALGAIGKIRWEPIINPYSVEARILSVADPTVPPNNSFKPNPLRGPA